MSGDFSASLPPYLLGWTCVWELGVEIKSPAPQGKKILMRFSWGIRGLPSPSPPPPLSLPRGALFSVRVRPLVSCSSGAFVRLDGGSSSARRGGAGHVKRDVHFRPGSGGVIRIWPILCRWVGPKTEPRKLLSLGFQPNGTFPKCEGTSPKCEGTQPKCEGTQPKYSKMSGLAAYAFDFTLTDDPVM